MGVIKAVTKDRMQYLLAAMMEEAAEVIHAAAKAHRFGLDHDEPGYGEGTNKDQITKELGDLLAVARLLDIDSKAVTIAGRRKLLRLRRVEQKFSRQIKEANVK